MIHQSTPIFILFYKYIKNVKKIISPGDGINESSVLVTSVRVIAVGQTRAGFNGQLYTAAFLVILSNELFVQFAKKFWLIDF